MPLSDLFDNLGDRLAQMKSLQLAQNYLAEQISKDINIPIWQVHNVFNNIETKIVPFSGSITVNINITENKNEISIV